MHEYTHEFVEDMWELLVVKKSSNFTGLRRLLKDPARSINPSKKKASKSELETVEIAMKILDFVNDPKNVRNLHWLLVEFACARLGFGETRKGEAGVGGTGAGAGAKGSLALVANGLAPDPAGKMVRNLVDAILSKDSEKLMHVLKPLIKIVLPMRPALMDVLIVWMKGLSQLADTLKVRGLSLYCAVLCLPPHPPTHTHSYVPCVARMASRV
jgi:hypothetical protein